MGGTLTRDERRKLQEAERASIPAQEGHVTDRVCIDCGKSINSFALYMSAEEADKGVRCYACWEKRTKGQLPAAAGKPRRRIGRVTATAEQLKSIDYAAVERMMIDTMQQQGYQFVGRVQDEYIFEESNV